MQGALTVGQQRIKNLKNARIRRAKLKIKDTLPGVAGVILLTIMMWFLIQMALEAFDQQWEAQCPVWYENGTPEYLNCMKRG